MINIKLITMKKIPVIICLLLIACNNNAPQAIAENKGVHAKHDSATVNATTDLQLNNGAKWKADEVTRKNVAAMVHVINDSDHFAKENKGEFVKQLQSRIDTLVGQCKMTGPDHDALHVWLEKVLQDLKEVKEKEDNEYAKAYAALKNDVESFYTFFE
jgi:hypothetical protein